MILIDTDILIYYAKKQKLHEISGNYISIITLIEFLRGVNKNKRKKVINIFKEIFEVLNIDDTIILKYCELYENLKKEGNLIQDADLLIAATAIAHNLKLKTNNKKHFKRLEKYGLKIDK